MGSKAIRTDHVLPTLHMAECSDGFWLYDDTRGMNLAMKAKTKEEAYVDTIKYYQQRLKKVEEGYRLLRSQVDAFIELTSEQDKEE